MCFFLGDIHKAHLKAKEEKLEFIDSASMMQHFGHTLYLVEACLRTLKLQRQSTSTHLKPI